MAAVRDYYKVLGVAPTSSAEDIRKAYRMLSKKYHPDLNPDLRLYSDEKMKELVAAYNILNDPGKRKEYDRQPQFQPRRFVKETGGRRAEAAEYTKKAKYQKEPSLLERIFSPFLKSKTQDESAATYDPKQADVHFTLGLSMTENESFYDQAKGEFRLSVKFRPDHKEAQYNLALMCYKRGEFEEALVHFQKVLTLDKEDQHARKMLNLLRDDF
ncbi:MAG: tetratricopeptide repeat protein [Armatimonadetes bacterium]|nr:tetratricopeptide repeat protein [Armatimonadota bacterium]